MELITHKQISLKVIAAFLVVSLSVAYSGCSTTGKNSSSLTLPMEREVGAEIHQQILSKYYVYTEPGINQYVTEIENRVSAHAKRQDLNYQVTILYDDNIFATSAPGGRIYISTGYLNFMENEAELAGVIAHEIGQLQYKEPRFKKTSKAVSGLYQLTMLAAPFFGAYGALAMLGMTGVHMIATKAKSKPGRVIQADRLALQYLMKAGFDPQGLLDILYRLIELPDIQAFKILEYERARPITRKRVEKLKGTFKKLPFEGKTLSSGYETFIGSMEPVKKIYRS